MTVTKRPPRFDAAAPYSFLHCPCLLGVTPSSWSSLPRGLSSYKQFTNISHSQLSVLSIVCLFHITVAGLFLTVCSLSLRHLLAHLPKVWVFLFLVYVPVHSPGLRHSASAFSSPYSPLHTKLPTFLQVNPSQFSKPETAFRHFLQVYRIIQNSPAHPHCQLAHLSPGIQVLPLHLGHCFSITLSSPCNGGYSLVPWLLRPE